MNPQISIILPVYNTGNILKNTINSILNQTFKDFELILVNDGSTDKSGDVCDEFAKLDSRIIVVHKKNGGICSARNTGLNIAKGEYITFCDHDDLFMPTILQLEYENAIDNNSDITIVGKTVEKLGKKTEYIFDLSTSIKQENILEMLDNNALLCVWNILYKKEVIADVRFDTRCKYGQEDVIFNLNVIKNADIISSVPQALYIHTVREGLSTSFKVYKEVIPVMIESSNKIYEVIEAYDFFQNNTKEKTIKIISKEIRKCLAYSVKAEVSYEEFLGIINKLKYIPEKNIFKIKNLDLKTKITYFLLSINRFKLLYIILNLNKIIK